MSDDAVTVEWPKEDVRAMWAQIARAQKELGRSTGQAVKFGAWSLARSLGAMTKVAPKYRPYKEVKESAGVLRSKGGGKKYEVTSYRQGRKNTFMIRSSKGVADLKKMPQVRIGRAGLAKSSWMWGISALGSTRGFAKKGMTSAAKSRGKLNVDVEKHLRGDDPFVKITNRLPYVRDSLEGGMAAVDTAMGKAARSMEKIIDDAIQKKLGAK